MSSLTPAQQSTLDGLREKITFNVGNTGVGGCFDWTSNEWVSDEAAYWLMVGRAKAELGPAISSIIYINAKVRVFRNDVNGDARCMYDGTDELAALLAALEPKKPKPSAVAGLPHTLPTIWR